jgi:hypothetical protein
MKTIFRTAILATVLICGCQKTSVRPCTVSTTEAALDCFETAQSLIHADVVNDIAERDLARQTTPGAAALKAIEYQEARERVKSGWQEYKTKLEILKKSEIKEKSTARQSIIIDRYLDEARSWARRWNDMDDPGYKRVRSLTLDEVVAKGGRAAVGP